MGRPAVLMRCPQWGRQHGACERPAQPQHPQEQPQHRAGGPGTDTPVPELDPTQQLAGAQGRAGRGPVGARLIRLLCSLFKNR